MLSAWSWYFKESFIRKHTVNGRLFNLPRAYSLRLTVAIKAYVRVCLASACLARFCTNVDAAYGGKQMFTTL